MALNKDVLGLALYNARQPFMDKNIDEVIATYGSIEAYRLAIAKADADEIIKHFKANIQITIPGAGLVAPSGGGPVTGASTTGTIL